MSQRLEAIFSLSHFMKFGHVSERLPCVAPLKQRNIKKFCFSFLMEWNERLTTISKDRSGTRWSRQSFPIGSSHLWMNAFSPCPPSPTSETLLLLFVALRRVRVPGPAAAGKGREALYLQRHNGRPRFDYDLRWRRTALSDLGHRRHRIMSDLQPWKAVPVATSEGWRVQWRLQRAV